MITIDDENSLVNVPSKRKKRLTKYDNGLDVQKGEEKSSNFFLLFDERNKIAHMLQQLLSNVSIPHRSSQIVRKIFLPS